MADYRYLHDPNFHVNPLTGARSELTIENDGYMWIKTTEDDDLLKRAAHESRMNAGKMNKFSDMQHCASIPCTVIYDLMRRGIWNDQDRMRSWLNSIESAPYRTHDYKV